MQAASGVSYTMLWGHDPVTCEALLAALVDIKFLRRAVRDAYVRAEGA